MKLCTVVVINPASKSGNAQSIHKVVTDLATQEGHDIVRTDAPGSATKIASSLSAKGIEVVVAVGGDGTINEVMNGLVGTKTALAVVPAGTGNDWARTVGIPSEPLAAWKVATDGQIVESDVGEAVGHKYFLNVAGVGFDAEVARCIGEAKGTLARLGPKPRYVAAVLKTFLGYHGADAKVSIDGEERDVDKLFLMAVAVAKYYGSGMMIAPDAEIDDGLFEIVWGHDVRTHELPEILKRIFKGAHIDHPKVEHCQCKELKLTSETALPFHLDGDVVGTLPVTFRIHKKALRIVVP